VLSSDLRPVARTPCPRQGVEPGFRRCPKAPGSRAPLKLDSAFPIRSHASMHRRRDPHDDPQPAQSRPPVPPVPTLGALLRPPGWYWLRCNACGHRVAVALAPFVIRWGADASSDMLRQQARCSACGRRGASLQHPSWGDAEVGWEVFPA
jgi:hypothetical protein